jgi:hypothetical protein
LSKEDESGGPFKGAEEVIRKVASAGKISTGHNNL